VTIVSVSVDGYTTSANIALVSGSNPETITLPSGFSATAGQVYTIDLGLSDGQSVAVSAVAQPSS
jgi:hypothetical protein